MQNTYLTNPNRKGFTLIEASISLVIVAMMFITAVGLAGNAVRAQRVRGDSGLGNVLAHDLLAEIIAQCYEEPFDVSTPDNPEPTEDNGTRINFDDIDDYNGWTATPPQYRNGETIDHAKGWTRSVTTKWIDPLTLLDAVSDTGMRRIAVTVTNPDGGSIEAAALRSRDGAFDVSADFDQEVAGHVEVRIQTAADPDSTVAIAVPMINQPASLETNLLKNAGMEDGLSYWIAATCNLTSNSSTVYSGAYSINSNFRSDPTSGPEQDLGTGLVSGSPYAAEVWVYPWKSLTMRVRLETTNDSAIVTSDFFDLYAPASTWTKLSGYLTPTWTGNLSQSAFRIESVGDASAFKFDHASLEPAG